MEPTLVQKPILPDPTSPTPQDASGRSLTILIVFLVGIIVAGGAMFAYFITRLEHSAYTQPQTSSNESTEQPIMGSDTPQTVYVSRKQGIAFYYPSEWIESTSPEAFKSNPQLVALLLIPHATGAPFGSATVTKIPTQKTVQEYAEYLREIARDDGKEILRDGFTTDEANSTYQTYTIFTGTVVPASSERASYNELQSIFVWPYKESDGSRSFVLLELIAPADVFEKDYLLFNGIVNGSITGNIPEDMQSTHAGQ